MTIYSNLNKKVKKNKVILSLGSNMGDRIAFLNLAVNELFQQKVIENVYISSVYETEPYGVKDQNWFLNIALSAFSDLQPEELLSAVKSVEKLLGRQQRERWHEREIDIDILFFGTEIVASHDLILPHPEIINRKFVLVPACEIDGGFIHPIYKISLFELLEKCKDDSIVRFYSNL